MPASPLVLASLVVLGCGLARAQPARDSVQPTPDRAAVVAAVVERLHGDYARAAERSADLRYTVTLDSAATAPALVALVPAALRPAKSYGAADAKSEARASYVLRRPTIGPDTAVVGVEVQLFGAPTDGGAGSVGSYSKTTYRFVLARDAGGWRVLSRMGVAFSDGTYRVDPKRP